MKAIIFDLDDTLIDHQASLRAGLRSVAQQHPILTEQPFAILEGRYIGHLEDIHHRVMAGEVTLDEARPERFRRLFRDYEQDIAEDALAETVEVFRAAYNGAEAPVPGALELLALIKTEGLAVGVITNHLAAEQQRKVRTYGLEPLVDYMIAADAFGSAKPHPEIFLHTLEKLGCDASQAVMVGDAWRSDIAGAAGVGMAAVWLNRYEKTCPDPSLAREIRALEPVEETLAVIRAAHSQHSGSK